MQAANASSTGLRVYSKYVLCMTGTTYVIGLRGTFISDENMLYQRQVQ